jgi:hypothetical protein
LPLKSKQIEKGKNKIFQIIQFNFFNIFVLLGSKQADEIVEVMMHPGTSSALEGQPGTSFEVVAVETPLEGLINDQETNFFSPLPSKKKRRLEELTDRVIKRKNFKDQRDEELYLKKGEVFNTELLIKEKEKEKALLELEVTKIIRDHLKEKNKLEIDLMVKRNELEVEALKSRNEYEKKLYETKLEIELENLKKVKYSYNTE